MPLLPRLSSLWRNLVHKDLVEQELSEEVRACLDLLTDEKVRDGLSPEEARRAALIELGGVEQVKESIRDVRIGRYIETVWQDLRYGVKMLMKDRSLTAAVVVTLALGIGVNTAVFSVINTVLLTPLPYAEPKQLVLVQESFEQNGRRAPNYIAPGNFFEWRAQNHSFTDLAYYTFSTTPRNLTGGGEPEKLEAMYVSDNLFDLLGVQSHLGRTFVAGEAKPGEESGAVLSYGLWQRRFGGDPSMVGKTVRLDGVEVTVIGVMPPFFEFPTRKADLWLAHALAPAAAGTRQAHYLQAVGRLKPGVTVEQADNELAAIAERMREQYPESNRYVGAMATPLEEEVVGDVRRPLLVLLAAAVFVLLIGCANVASLLLARAAARQKEIAVRTAIGAGRWRIVRQLLTESLVLAVAGGLAGLLLALWGVPLLVELMPDDIAQGKSAAVDLRVLGFALAASLLTGLIFGLAPAMYASKPDLNYALKEGSGIGQGVARQRLRGLLVVVEIAVSIVLLTGAGLLVRSFVLLNQIDPGFRADHLLTFEVPLPYLKYPDAAKRATFFAELTQRLQAMPEVEAAGVTTIAPLKSWGGGMTFITEQKGETRVVSALPRVTDGGFFQALGVPLIRGRLFDERDGANAPGVVIITEALAHTAWPNEDPIGKRLKMGIETNPWLTVVGLVSDTRTLLTTRQYPIVYLPYEQNSAFAPRDVIVRTKIEPLMLATAVREAVWAIDKEQPVAAVRTMEGIISESLGRERFNLLLLTTFAALAVVMAGVGIYGVMSYTVMQHTREIGIRIALGAQNWAVLKLFMGHGLTLTLAGVATGTAAAYGLTRLMASLLYGVKPTDPVTFGAVTVFLVSIAMLACYLPARRAAKVDPLVALRYE